MITAVAGYFVILRGKTFNVGDRIMMGGVRGDVIDLSFMQTQIMEMGQSPKEQGDAPSMWVRSRQFTGRIVTVTNDKVFDEPVYNYIHDFPYIWDEINLPVRYEDDRAKAEMRYCSSAARRHAVTREKIGEEEVKRLEEQVRDQRRRHRPADLLADHRQLARDDGALPRARSWHSRDQGPDEPRNPGRARQGEDRDRLRDHAIVRSAADQDRTEGATRRRFGERSSAILSKPSAMSPSTLLVSRS